jgi:hypothetical protein
LGFAASFFRVIPRFPIFSTNFDSLGVSNSRELPLDLYLAVLPTLWI